MTPFLFPRKDEGKWTHSDQRQQNPVHVFEMDRLEDERDIRLPSRAWGPDCGLKPP